MSITLLRANYAKTLRANYAKTLRTNYAKTLRANYGAKLLKIPDLCKCLYNFYIKRTVFPSAVCYLPSFFPLPCHLSAP